MSQETVLVARTPDGPDEEAIDLLDLATSFIVEWRVAVSTALAVFVAGTIVVITMQSLYQASATLLPQSKDEQYSLSSIFGGRSPGDVYLGLLASRTIQYSVIDQLGLVELYNVKSREKARDILAGQSVFKEDKGALVSIQIKNKDARVAQQIADAYLDALEKQQRGMALQAAEARSEFYKAQVAIESDALADAEKALAQVQKNTGIVQPDQQTQIGLNAIASVRQQITARQVELASMLLGESDQAPQVQAMRSQIAQLQAQERAMESSQRAGGSGAAAPAAKMPELNMEYARKQREVKYHEALFQSLANQYEAARLTEGSSTAPFVVVDRAVVPETKTWPPRKLLLLLLFFVSVFLGIVAAGLKLIWTKISNDPGQKLRIARIKASFRRSPAQV